MSGRNDLALADGMDMFVKPVPDDQPKRRLITLVRHGRSAHLSAYRRARLDEMQCLLDAYDRTGIDPASLPQQRLLDEVSSANLVVASMLTRAVESAWRLVDPGDGPTPMLNELFREVELPKTPKNGLGLRLDPFLWVLLFRFAWLFRFYSGDVPSPRAVWRRAGEAADCLLQLSALHGHVVLVGHNMLNYLIGRALLSRNWRGELRFQRHWEFQTFTGDV